MAKISPMMIAPPAIFAGLALMFFLGLGREDQLPSARQGQEAPAIEIVALGGAPMFDDAAMRDGTVKLVNFWASWCAPCRIEHPNLEALAAQGITLYGVNYKDKPENAIRFLEDVGNPYTAIGADSKGRMALNWGVYGVPETYIIDGDGVIVLRFAGPITAKVLAKTILPAIEVAKGN